MFYARDFLQLQFDVQAIEADHQCHHGDGIAGGKKQAGQALLKDRWKGPVQVLHQRVDDVGNNVGE